MKQHSAAFWFVPVLGVLTSLAMLGAQPALGQGNSAAAHWCAANFPPAQRGECVSQAAHGTGPFYTCGPGGTNVGLCGGVGGVCCMASEVCAANACATPTPTATLTDTPTPTPTDTPTCGAGAVSPLSPIPPLGDLIYTASQCRVLMTPNDVNSLNLQLNAGETLTLVGTPTNSAQLQLVISVIAPGGNIVAAATAPAAGQNVVVETVPVTTTDTYVIHVSDAGGNPGAYDIQEYLNTYLKQGTSNISIGSASDISSSSYLLGPGDADRVGATGTIDSSGDADFYQFNLTTGQSATMVANGLNGKAALITLVDGSGNVLATGVGGSSNVDSKIENYVAGYSGTHYVEITGGPSVQYSLTVTRSANFDIEPHNTIATAQSLIGTNGVLGALDSIANLPAVNNDWYSIDIAAGSNLSLQSSTPSDEGGQFTNTVSVNIELYDTLGNLVAVGTPSADGRNQTLLYNVAITAKYFVHVFNSPGSTGEYYLSVHTM